MLTRRTIEAAASAAIESLGVDPADAARRAADEELFAELAVKQLLRLTGAELRARSTWAGYQGIAVARQLLEAFVHNWFRWEPSMSLIVADAALAIARRSDRHTASLLFEALKQRANALHLLNRCEEAFRVLDEAEDLASDTRCPRLHHAMVAYGRAAVLHELLLGNEALEYVLQAREGFVACNDRRRVTETLTAETAIHFIRGRNDDARRVAETALNDSRSSGDDAAAALNFGNLAIAVSHLGDTAMARKYLERAQSLYKVRRWQVLAVNISASLALLKIREQGSAGLKQMETVFVEYDRLGLSGEAARSRLLAATELLTVEPQSDVESLCRAAYTRAISLGMTSVAGDAQRLMGATSSHLPS